MEFVLLFGWITTISTFVVQLMGLFISTIVQMSISIFLGQLMGLDICFKIYKKGGTGDISAMVFVANFTAASLWLRYGILQSLEMIIITNSIGALLNFFYLLLFYYYTTKKNLFIRTIFLDMTFIFVVLYYVKYHLSDYRMAANHLGKVCVTLSVIAYGAPLTSLRAVIRSRSTECLSFKYIFCNFVIAVEWVMYGKLLNDIYVQMPNFVGLCLSLGQLTLFCIYPSRTAKEIIVKPPMQA